MRRLVGAIPRALPDHRTAAAVSYQRYCRAVLARLGPVGADGARWLKEAGLLTLSLDQLHGEADDARAVLQNGSGRRARDKARVTLRQLERRAARLRGSLESAERRLELLAGTGHPPRVPTPAELMAGLREAQRAR